MEYARVARKLPPSRRRPGLSFTHHQLVAARPPEEQDEWLDAAEAHRWSTEELRGLLQKPPPALSTRRELMERVEDAARALLAATVPDAPGWARVPADAVERLTRALDAKFVADVDHRYEELVDALADAEVKPPAVVAKRNARNAKLARRGRPTMPTLRQEARLHAEHQVAQLLEASEDPEAERLRHDLDDADRMRVQRKDPLPGGSELEWA
jgi:hypothetical protein